MKFTWKPFEGCQKKWFQKVFKGVIIVENWKVVIGKRLLLRYFEEDEDVEFIVAARREIVVPIWLSYLCSYEVYLFI